MPSAQQNLALVQANFSNPFDPRRQDLQVLTANTLINQIINNPFTDQFVMTTSNGRILFNSDGSRADDTAVQYPNYVVTVTDGFGENWIATLDGYLRMNGIRFPQGSSEGLEAQAGSFNPFTGNAVITGPQGTYWEHLPRSGDRGIRFNQDAYDFGGFAAYQMLGDAFVPFDAVLIAGPSGAHVLGPAGPIAELLGPRGNSQNFAVFPNDIFAATSAGSSDSLLRWSIDNFGHISQATNFQLSPLNGPYRPELPVGAVAGSNGHLFVQRVGTRVSEATSIPYVDRLQIYDANPTIVSEITIGNFVDSSRLSERVTGIHTGGTYASGNLYLVGRLQAPFSQDYYIPVTGTGSNYSIPRVSIFGSFEVTDGQPSLLSFSNISVIHANDPARVAQTEVVIPGFRPIRYSELLNGVPATYNSPPANERQDLVVMDPLGSASYRWSTGFVRPVPRIARANFSRALAQGVPAEVVVDVNPAIRSDHVQAQLSATGGQLEEPTVVRSEGGSSQVRARFTPDGSSSASVEVTVSSDSAAEPVSASLSAPVQPIAQVARANLGTTQSPNPILLSPAMFEENSGLPVELRLVIDQVGGYFTHVNRLDEKLWFVETPAAVVSDFLYFPPSFAVPAGEEQTTLDPDMTVTMRGLPDGQWGRPRSANISVTSGVAPVVNARLVFVDNGTHLVAPLNSGSVEVNPENEASTVEFRVVKPNGLVDSFSRIKSALLGRNTSTLVVESGNVTDVFATATSDTTGFRGPTSRANISVNRFRPPELTPSPSPTTTSIANIDDCFFSCGIAFGALIVGGVLAFAAYIALVKMKLLPPSKCLKPINNDSDAKSEASEDSIELGDVVEDTPRSPQIGHAH